MAHRREPSLDFDSLLSSWDAGAMPDVVDEACGSPVRHASLSPVSELNRFATGAPWQAPTRVPAEPEVRKVSVAPFSRSAAARRKAGEIQSRIPALSAPPLAPGRL